MVFIIVIADVGGALRTGDAGIRRYVAHVGYDAAERVQSWRWLEADGSGQASDGGSPAAPAAKPEKLLSFRADRVFFTGDDQVLVVDLAEPGSMVVERVEVATGVRSDSWRGPDRACRAAIALRPGRALQLEQVADRFLGAPLVVSRNAAPCRWRIAGPGRLEADILRGVVPPEAFLAARLAGGMVLREDPDDGIAVFAADGSRLATLPLRARLVHVAADAEGARLLVQTRASGSAGASYWLVDRPLFRPEALGRLAPLGLDETCRKTAPALAPDGRRVGFACAAHVQIWRLGETAAETGLERLLPLPGSGAMAALAFSSDGARLVAATPVSPSGAPPTGRSSPFFPQPMPALIGSSMACGCRPTAAGWRPAPVSGSSSPTPRGRKPPDPDRLQPDAASPPPALALGRGERGGAPCAIRSSMS